MGQEDPPTATALEWRAGRAPLFFLEMAPVIGSVYIELVLFTDPPDFDFRDLISLFGQ